MKPFAPQFHARASGNFGLTGSGCHNIVASLCSSPVNWTTTTVPLWQVDCENFRKTGQSFELRDVSTEEHSLFIEAFAARYDLQVKHGDGVAIFEGTGKKKTQSYPSESRQFSA